MKKLLVLLCVLALAAFSLAACGDDEEDTDTGAATTEEPTATEPADGGGGGGGGETVDLAADPGGDLAFSTDSLEAPAGQLTIELENEASVPHNVCLEDGGDLGCSETISGDTTELTATVEPGDYTFYCSVSGHREAGMEGTLSVK